MKKLLFLLLALALPFSDAFGRNGTIRRAGGSALKDRYIVALKDRSEAAVPHLARSIAAAYGGELLYVYEAVLGGFALRISDEAASLHPTRASCGLKRIVWRSPEAAYQAFSRCQTITRYGFLTALTSGTTTLTVRSARPTVTEGRAPAFSRTFSTAG